MKSVEEFVLSDWRVTQAHAEEIAKCLPRTIRPPVVRKYITGARGKRITDQLKSGVWMKPIGSDPSMTFSTVQDVVHSSLLIIAEGSSTGDSRGTPIQDEYRQVVRRLFHNRRGTCLPCEMYSTVVASTYAIDEALQRKMDVQVFVISSKFRESR